jgi:hypothetical protein
MVQINSGVTWFEDDDWIGSEIVFKSPTVSNWEVTRKIAEHEECVGEQDVEDRVSGIIMSWSFRVFKSRSQRQRSYRETSHAVSPHGC